MALQMPFTTADGVTHEESYWMVSEVNLCVAERRGRVILNGYHEADARSEGKAVIAQKAYYVSPELFESYFDTEVLDEKGKNAIAQAYKMAKTVAEEGADLGASFFAEADDV